MKRINCVEHDAWIVYGPEEHRCTRLIASAARVCTCSTGTEDDDRDLVCKLMKWGHWSPFEFVTLCWSVRTSRAVANELVRHRLASYMQQSQRYVGYDVLDVVEPVRLQRSNFLVRAVWRCAQRFGFACYRLLLRLGVRREDARTVLSTATGTRMLVGMNLREFRHFLNLRTDKAAWVEMRLLADRMARAFAKRYPDEVYLIEDVWKERGL